MGACRPLIERKRGAGSMGSEGSEGAVPESGIQVTSPQPLIPNPWFRRLLVCQTYVTPCLMKSWSVSFGDFHPSGRIGKQL